MKAITKLDLPSILELDQAREPSKHKTLLTDVWICSSLVLKAITDLGTEDIDPIGDRELLYAGYLASLIIDRETYLKPSCSVGLTHVRLRKLPTPDYSEFIKDSPSFIPKGGILGTDAEGNILWEAQVQEQRA